MAKDIIKEKEKAREIFFETDRNILLYGGEEVLDELLKSRKGHKQTLICAGTKKLAVIRDCIWLDDVLKMDSETTEKVISCCDLCVLYGIDRISAWELEKLCTARNSYNRRLRLIFVGDMKTALVCRKIDFKTAAMTPFWRSLDLMQIDLREPNKDADFQKWLDSLRDGSTAMLKDINDYCYVQDDGDPPVRLYGRSYKAEKHNQREMQHLPNPKHTYTAFIDGDMPESAYPMPAEVTFACNMPVMVTASPQSEDVGKVFRVAAPVVYNGAPGKETVRTDDNKHRGRHKWYKRRLKCLTDEFDDSYLVYEKVGSFEQMPLIPAYALDLNSSYERTLEHLLIDPTTTMEGELAALFARCSDPEGLYLERPVTVEDLKFSKENLDSLNNS